MDKLGNMALGYSVSSVTSTDTLSIDDGLAVIFCFYGDGRCYSSGYGHMEALVHDAPLLLPDRIFLCLSGSDRRAAPAFAADVLLLPGYYCRSLAKKEPATMGRFRPAS